MTDQKEILYESDEAAKYVTGISGWVSSTGRFFGKEEHLARYDGCTHKLCDCGKPMERGWTKCEDCRRKADYERYMAMPEKEWNGEYLYSRAYDKFFFSEDDVQEFLEEEEIEFNDLQAVACEPNYLSTLELDSDLFPEDMDTEDVVSKEVLKALDALNEMIQAHKPISYEAGKVRLIKNNSLDSVKSEA